VSWHLFRFKALTTASLYWSRRLHLGTNISALRPLRATSGSADSGTGAAAAINGYAVIGRPPVPDTPGSRIDGSARGITGDNTGGVGKTRESIGRDITNVIGVTNTAKNAPDSYSARRSNPRIGAPGGQASAVPVLQTPTRQAVPGAHFITSEMFDVIHAPPATRPLRSFGSWRPC